MKTSRKLKVKRQKFCRNIVVMFAFLLFTFAFSSCLTVGKIERNCDKFAQVCVSDRQVETVVEYCDTTIYIHDSVFVALPSDTVTLSDTVTIINNRAFLPKIRREKGNVWVSASVNNSVLFVDGGLVDSTLLIPYRDSVIVQQKQTTTTDVQYITLPPEKYKTKFTKICIWWFFICLFSGLLAVALFVVSKVYTAKFNAVLAKIKGFKNKVTG